MPPKRCYDAIVIGLGAGGAACAYALARRGVAVLALEAGPHFNPASDYRLDQTDWELHDFPGDAARDRVSYARLQPLQADYAHLMSRDSVSGRLNTTDRRLPNAYFHARGVGGSTLHFTGEAHRLHERAFRIRSLTGVGADWPLDYQTLAPWYDEAEQLIGVAGDVAAPGRPRRTPFPLPAHARSYAARHVASSASAFGWQSNSLAVLSAPREGRPGCNFCNCCTRGCPRRDKGSTDVTFVPAALATGHLTIQPEAEVTRILTAANDAVSGVEWRDAHGAEHSAGARVIVIAGGAVETPRLLLNSASSQHPDGIANDSGQVGRHFLETLAFTVSGLQQQDIGSHRGLPSELICWDFNAPDALKDIPGGFRFGLDTTSSHLHGPVAYASRLVAGWGAAHKQAMRDSFGRAICLAGIGESLPDPGSFVDLDPARKDAHGLPRARIHSQLSALEIRRIEKMAMTLKEALAATGVDEVAEQYGSYDYFGATHVFGTCRMGSDPQTSVTDAYGRCHRFRNLYVADASVFPSSGGGEAPSLTIEALALRTGAEIARRLKAREIR